MIECEMWNFGQSKQPEIKVILEDINKINDYIEKYRKNIIENKKNFDKNEKIFTISIVEKKTKKEDSEKSSDKIILFEVDFKTDFDQELIGQDLSNLIDSIQQHINGKIVIESKVKNLNTSLVLNGYLLTQWKFDHCKTNEKQRENNVFFILNQGEIDFFNKILYKTKSVILYRYLAHLPANILNPEIYENVIKEIFKKTDIKVEVINHEKLSEIGANLLVAVGQSAVHKSRLIILTKESKKSKKSKEAKNKKKLALVGKGVMYDTGGLSLKDSDNMKTMYYDMSGSASVLCTIYGLQDEDIDLIGLLPVVENAIGPNSYRPGDIYKSLSGKTVEIGNTDAEGRLILADSCQYAAKYLECNVIITIATLTGATRVALGQEYCSLLTQNEDLKNQLVNTGKLTGNLLHALPFDDAYLKYLKSDRADLNNISSKGAGTITAWKFIEHLIEKDVQFAGIDIAAFSDKTVLSKNLNDNGNIVRVLIDIANNFNENDD